MASETIPEPQGSSHQGPSHQGPSHQGSSPDVTSAPQNSGQAEAAQLQSEVQPQTGSEKFTLPTSSRSPVLQVLGGEPRAVAPARPEEDESMKKAAAQVLEREAKARLLALRRIEWVAIGLATVLLGGATYSWRTNSDTREGRRQAFNASPAPRREPSWRAARPAEVKAASEAIKGQLDAFKRDDYEKAAAWQSEELKQNFGSVGRFRSYIKSQSPAFAAYKSVRFSEAGAQGDGGLLRIKVALQGPGDARVTALYLLVRQGGAYRIAGVSPLPGSQPEPRPQNPRAPEPRAPLPPVEAA